MAEGSLDAGDIYALLDGGATGNVGTLRSALQSHDKASTTFTIVKDLASMDHVGDIEPTEPMLVVSRNQLSLPPVLAAIGPAVRAPIKVQ